MAAPALADALRDFGAVAFSRHKQEARPAPLLHDMVDETPPPAPDPAIIRAEVEKAEAALREELAREHEALLAIRDAAHQQELLNQEREMSEAFGLALSQRLDATEARLVELTTQSAARILGSVLNEDLQRRAIAELARIVAEAVEDREAIRIRARGPASLYEALASALGPRAGRIDFTEVAQVDLSLAIEDSLFETRLAEWSDALSEVLP